MLESPGVSTFVQWRLYRRYIVNLADCFALQHLEALLGDQNPSLQAACLYIIAQLEPERGKTIASQFSSDSSKVLRETAELLLSLPVPYSSLDSFPTLEKVVYLFNSDFFHRMHSETLVSLAERADVKTYTQNQVITEAGDTCRELLLLLSGDAEIRYQLTDDEIRVESLHPGQTLDD